MTTDAGQSQGALNNAGAMDEKESALSGTTQLQGWIDQINNAFGFSICWVIKAGDLLAQSKKQLGHGHWGSLFGPEKLKFGQRTAEMLMEIARHPSLRKSKNFSSLPRPWTALHALSKLPVEVVDDGIAKGSIHSEMTLAEARDFVRTAQGKMEITPATGKRPAGDLADPVSCAMRYVVTTFDRLQISERGELIENIRNLLGDLERELARQRKQELIGNSLSGANATSTT